MGSPAILTYTDEHGRRVLTMYQHWASPCYQLAYLAALVHDTAGNAPTAEQYLAAAFHPDNGLDLPTEPVAADTDTGPDFRYDLRRVVPGWPEPARLEVTVSERRRPGDKTMRTAHRIAGPFDLYRIAAGELRVMAERARQLIAENPGSARLLPEPAEVDAEADRITGWADEALAPAAS